MKAEPLAPAQTEPLDGFNDYTVHELRRARSAWAPFRSSLVAVVVFAIALAAVLALLVVGSALKKVGL